MNKKPVYEISRVDIVPELDGWLQSPCWQTAKWVERFLAMDTWQPGKPVAVENSVGRVFVSNIGS